mgnify:CR=1 FL=1
MKTWRVGSFSMGLSLMLAGLGMIWSLFTQAVIPPWLLKWWPLILILLGIEIVAANFIRPERFRYDGFSIFIVLAMLIAGGGLYMVQASGILERGRQLLTYQQYPFQHRQEISLEDGTTLLRIKSPGPQATLIPYEGKEIVLLSSGSITAGSKEEAEEATGGLYTAERVGGQLNLTLHRLPQPSAFRHSDDRHEVTLYVPRSLPLILEQDVGQIDIQAEEMRANWTIEGESRVFLTAGRNADFTLLHQQPVTLSPPGSEEKEVNAAPVVPQAQKRLFGKGTYTLTVRSSSPVEFVGP